MYQYWQATGDDDFMCAVGVPVILETAVYWADRAEKEKDRYAIRDVIGPDEYHEHVDNNFYTNWMVKWHLDTALAVRDWLRKQSPADMRKLDKQLNLSIKTLAYWRDVADNIILLWDQETGLIEQFEGFFKLEEIDWADYEDRTQSMQAILGIEGANKVQVLKQPDVLTTLCLFRDEFENKTWRANWDYYAPRTDHKYASSLGPAFHAWAACETNDPAEAYEHFARAARTDLYDSRGNTHDGVHGATMGGMWQAVVFGFAGLKPHADTYALSPRLPAHWKRLAFTIYLHGKRHQIDIRPEQAASPG